MFHIYGIHFFDALQSTKTISQAQEDHFSTKSHLEIYVFLLALNFAMITKVIIMFWAVFSLSNS